MWKSTHFARLEQSHNPLKALTQWQLNRYPIQRHLGQRHLGDIQFFSLNEVQQQV